MRIVLTLVSVAILTGSAFAQNASREFPSPEVVIDTINTVSIATARKDSSNFKAWYLNDTVKVAGVVTTPNLQASSNTTAYCIQDTSGGIYVYYGKTPSMNFSVGDSISVIGQIQQYHGLTELVPLDGNHVVLLKHSAAVPAPVRLTLDQIASASVVESYESMLIEVDTLYKSSGTWPAAGSNASIYVTNASGSKTAQLYINKNTDVPGTKEHLYPVNVIGVVSQYGTDSTGYEIIPPDSTDIWKTPGVVSRATIAQARVDANGDLIPDYKVTGDTLAILGVVTSPNMGSSYTSYYIQDATAGIDVYKSGTVMSFSIGDSVFVVGTILQSHGLTEISPLAADSAHCGLLKHNAVVPKPKRITLHQYALNPEAYEGTLIEVDSLYKLGGSWGAGKTDSVTNGAKTDTALVYLNANTNVGKMAEPTYPINVIGIGSQYSSGISVVTGGYEIIPPDSTDITKASVTPVPTIKKVTIAQARVEHNWIPDYSTSGDTIEVSGVVVSPNLGALSATPYSSYFIEDSTAGVDVYSPTLMNYQVGDSVFVIGTVDQYNGLEEVVPLVGDSVHFGLLKHGAALLQPKHLSVSAFADAHNAEFYEGQLIEIDTLYKTSGTWPGAGSSSSIYVSNFGGTKSIQLYINKNTNVPGTKEHLYPVNMIGVVSQYGTDSTGYEIIPTDSTDIWQTPGLPSLYTIAQAGVRSDGFTPDHKAIGDTLTVTGVVTTPNLQGTSGTSYCIQDGTGGIDVFVAKTVMNFSRGDSVFVVGKITQYHGLVEDTLFAADSAHFGLLKHNATMPKPRHVTAHQFLQNAETYESQLVEVDSLYKVSGTWPASGAYASIYLTNASKSDTIQLYINKTTNVAGSPEPTYPINVVGVGSQYSPGSTVNSGYEIIPRDTSDISSTVITPVTTIKKVTIAEARVEHNWISDHATKGDTLQVYGVVTTPNLGAQSNNTSYFVQDSTAGIGVFISGAVMDFKMGDSVSVIGTVDQYNGLTEIVPLAADSVHFGVLKHNAVLPLPVVLSFHEFASNAAFAESHEGQLIMLDSLYKAKGTWPSSGSNASIYLTDASKADTAQLFINKNTDVAGWKEPEYPVNVVGVVSQYGSDSTGYEIIPRDTTDIVHLTIVGVNERQNGIPADFYLSQNYPNPFNPSTTIQYGLPKDAQVQIEVYNVLGQRVALLVDSNQKAGNHQVVFNADKFSSGVYLYIMRVDNRIFKLKMLFMK